MWNSIKRQLRSVIEWNNPQNEVLFYRWSENGDEIKNASSLIVGPGQGCIFVYEGKVVGLYESEGIVKLDTANIPFWTTITKVMQSFESEHKVGLYFFKKTTVLDQKWGTLSPIKYDDPKYKFPVGLMAYGNYSFHITDARLFFTSILGAQELYLVDDFRTMMSSRLSEPIAHYLANAQLSYAQIDSKRQEISENIETLLTQEFHPFGFILSDFRIEGTDFDPQTQERISSIADIAADVHAADSAGVSYGELQRLQAMRDAANNQAGAAGMMMGMGVGGALAGQTTTSSPATPSPKERLLHLKELFDENLISSDEYNAKKSAILETL